MRRRFSDEQGEARPSIAFQRDRAGVGRLFGTHGHDQIKAGFWVITAADMGGQIARELRSLTYNCSISNPFSLRVGCNLKAVSAKLHAAPPAGALLTGI